MQYISLYKWHTHFYMHAGTCMCISIVYKWYILSMGWLYDLPTTFYQSQRHPSMQIDLGFCPVSLCLETLTAIIHIGDLVFYERKDDQSMNWQPFWANQQKFTQSTKINSWWKSYANQPFPTLISFRWPFVFFCCELTVNTSSRPQAALLAFGVSDMADFTHSINMVFLQTSKVPCDEQWCRDRT